MADVNAVNIPHDDSVDIILPEVRCFTKVRNVKCKFTWKIQHYKTACGKKGVILKSLPFSATNDTCNWFLELHAKDDDYNYLGLYLKAYSIDEVSKYGPLAGDLKFSIINNEGQETTTRKEDFSVTTSKTHHCFEYFIKNDELLNNEIKLLPQNTLTILCEVNFVKHESKIDFPEQYCFTDSETDDVNPLTEFEKLYTKEDYSDITIYVNGKPYPAHRTILAARSPVFAAMLKHNTKENQLSRIDVKDIDEQVFLEALRFIYTGKVQDLEILAFELLPVADKYDLKKLKAKCEIVLFSKMSAETVVKILVLADMHNVKSLKTRAIDYIRAYSLSVVNLMDKEAWNDLTSRPQLMKDILESYMKR
ncbi:speckle-type POZ protein-like [Planococcus citri]|uniref:speckle-type POZ protein-like n=1 Tax=Planococcus citri TaxID=170843 RepID=UPI0031F7814A